jgi:hypothetical protein
MTIVRSVLFAGLLVLYGSIFAVQEQKAQTKNISLEFALPASFHTIAAGYLKQLAAEMLFIKTSVFLGGLRPGTPQTSYEDTLSNNFTVMTSLYPRFIDPYYFCQAFLPPLSSEAAGKANTVLATGITAHPEDFILRFYQATNYILYLNEPLKSAEAFAETSQLPSAPPIFGHLAAVFSAQGGDIAAGLISLKTLLASEKDEDVRSRYQTEIVIFEQALQVNAALMGYQKKYSTSPHALQELVPEFISVIPDIKDAFVLVYDPPTLRLERPQPLQKRK